jgi:hypothetical protein
MAKSFNNFLRELQTVKDSTTLSIIICNIKHNIPNSSIALITGCISGSTENNFTIKAMQIHAADTSVKSNATLGLCKYLKTIDTSIHAIEMTSNIFWHCKSVIDLKKLITVSIIFPPDLIHYYFKN